MSAKSTHCQIAYTARYFQPAKSTRAVLVPTMPVVSFQHDSVMFKRSSKPRIKTGDAGKVKTSSCSFATVALLLWLSQLGMFFVDAHCRTLLSKSRQMKARLAILSEYRLGWISTTVPSFAAWLWRPGDKSIVAVKVCWFLSSMQLHQCHGFRLPAPRTFTEKRPEFITIPDLQF
jgi:hypothetical protein